MKKLIATAIAATAIASGAVIAADGPAPLTLTQLDAVSAGASAAAKGATSVRWSHGGVSVKNKTKSKSYGNALEAADASQHTFVGAVGIGGLVAWEAVGSTQSSAGAISYYPHYSYHYGY